MTYIEWRDSFPEEEIPNHVVLDCIVIATKDLPKGGLEDFTLLRINNGNAYLLQNYLK